MKRRGFIKGVLAGIVCLFVPKAKAVSRLDMPPLPTLKWLKEHDEYIVSVWASYRNNHRWGSLDKEIEMYWDGGVRRNSPGQPDDMVSLEFKNDKWQVNGIYELGVDTQGEGSSRIEWPEWLRKF